MKQKLAALQTDVPGMVSLTSITGGGVGGVLGACLTTILLRRMSVPGGGPSK